MHQRCPFGQSRFHTFFVFSWGFTTGCNLVVLVNSVREHTFGWPCFKFSASTFFKCFQLSLSLSSGSNFWILCISVPSVLTNTNRPKLNIPKAYNSKGFFFDWKNVLHHVGIIELKIITPADLFVCFFNILCQ